MSDYLVNRIEKVLARYKTANPFRPTGLKPEEFETLRKGVCCSRCGSFDVHVSNKYIKCISCNYSFMKREVILNVARELRYIFIDNEEMVTSTNVLRLLDNKVKRSTVNKMLSSYFDKKSAGPSIYYDVKV